jgi:F-type H+-transporting ATPase subunit gamma
LGPGGDGLVILRFNPGRIRNVSRLRNVERHAHSLADIRDILNSMKSLAYMESRKLGRIADAQRAVTEEIVRVAADFLHFHPDLLPAGPAATTVWIVVGTERGFCGNLNQRLLAELRDGRQADDDSVILAVGRKLHATMEIAMPGHRGIEAIEGAGVAEEVPAVLELLVEALDTVQRKHGALSAWCLSHGGDGEMLSRALLPAFRDAAPAAESLPHPPLLNLAPQQLLVDLSDQYLLSALYEILYNSLMNENVQRVAHLGDAVKHLDDQRAILAHKANALRQEEIVEEIEVLLLNSAGFERARGRQ